MEIRRRPPNPTVRVENLEYAVPHREAKAKNILEEIVWYKDTEIKNFKKIISLEDLIKKLDKLPIPKDFRKSILQSKIKPGVIAEIKKASPSKGVISNNFDPKLIATSYTINGASCLSVLTDNQYFKGDLSYLNLVKGVTDLPILRKDFIIDKYQIYQSKFHKADCILLIASILDANQLLEFESIAHSLGMDVLVEIHDEEELKKLSL